MKTAEEVIFIIKEFYALHRITPFSREMIFLVKSYIKAFGTWNATLEASGLEINKISENSLVDVKCAECHNAFTTKLDPRNTSGNVFCCQSCAASYNNKKRLRRTPALVCSVSHNENKIKLTYSLVCLQCNKVVLNKKYLEGQKFCNLDCSNAYRKAKAVRHFHEVILPQVENGLEWKRSVLRRFLIHRDGYKCVECGLTEWRGHPVPLCVDHKDGNASNNTPENIHLICQNCHGITPTFAGRNRGNGRKSRGMNKLT